MRADRGQLQTAREPQTPAALRRALWPGDDVPADLRRRFARFRQARTPGTRVPNDLRQAVLRALDHGVAMLTLRRELGVSAKQVADWLRRASITTAAIEPAARVGSARVFEVADLAAGDQRRLVAGDGGEALELRLGSWLIAIRPARP